MMSLMLAGLLQSSAAAHAWDQYQTPGAIAFACAETGSSTEHMDVAREALVIGSRDGFPQHRKIRLLVHDPKLFLGSSGVSTFSWSDDKDGLPMITFFSDTSAKDQHVLLLKQRSGGFGGISGPLSGKPDHYYGCVIMRGDAATQFIGKFVSSGSEHNQ